jgi:two-component sensor histidine kinase
VEPPHTRGFGLKLVEKEVAYNLGGKAEFEFSTKGITVRVGIKTEDGTKD